MSRPALMRPFFNLIEEFSLLKNLRISVLTLAVSLSFGSGQLQAQATQAQVSTLKQAYEAAWARQPEALSLLARRDAAAARQEIADSWLAEPAALELSTKTDQINKNLGRREYVTGIALPLWLPGESALAGKLAEAESRADSSRVLAAQLRTAATVREAWWNAQRSRGEQAIAVERLTKIRALADDVAKRVKVGDLARADQHQADGAVASAEIELAEAESGLATMMQNLRTLVGSVPDMTRPDSNVLAESLPAVPADFSRLDNAHPLVIELFDRAEVARRSVDLAKVQTRANPELTLATTSERELFADPYHQTITVGLRIPFGSDSRNRAKASQAQAEAIEAEGQLQLERGHLVASLDSARLRVESLRNQQVATERRVQLARESRGFFEKSFRLGETDLPTRLRIDLDAAEAEKQAARARIDLAAAISALRQSLGLLPQ